MENEEDTYPTGTVECPYGRKSSWPLLERSGRKTRNQLEQDEAVESTREFAVPRS